MVRVGVCSNESGMENSRTFIGDSVWRWEGEERLARGFVSRTADLKVAAHYAETKAALIRLARDPFAHERIHDDVAAVVFSRDQILTDQRGQRGLDARRAAEAMPRACL